MLLASKKNENSSNRFLRSENKSYNNMNENMQNKRQMREYWVEISLNKNFLTSKVSLLVIWILFENWLIQSQVSIPHLF